MGDFLIMLLGLGLSVKDEIMKDVVIPQQHSNIMKYKSTSDAMRQIVYDLEHGGVMARYKRNHPGA